MSLSPTLASRRDALRNIGIGLAGIGLAQLSRAAPLAGNIDPSTIFVFPNHYGAVGDNQTDDTLALQKALDVCDQSGLILHLGTGRYKISKGLTTEGRFGGITCSNSSAGLYPTGSGYTALTIGLPVPKLNSDPNYSFRTNTLDVAVFGTGNQVNGILLNSPAQSNIQRLHAFNLDGFGVHIDRCWNSIIQLISTERCGNADYYAVELRGAPTASKLSDYVASIGSEINRIHVLKIEAELSKEKSIYIGHMGICNMFDAIHSERANSTIDAPTWVLGGSTCLYNNVELQADTPNNCTAHISASASVFNILRFDGIHAHFESWGKRNPDIEEEYTLTINQGNFVEGASRVTIAQDAEAQQWLEFNGCTFKELTSHAGRIRVNNSRIHLLTLGWANADTNLYSNCLIDLLSHPTADEPCQASFHTCRIKQIKDNLPSFTRLIHSHLNINKAALYLKGRIIESSHSTLYGNITLENSSIRAQSTVFAGDIANAPNSIQQSLFDSACYAQGIVKNLNAPPVVGFYLKPHATGMRHYNISPKAGQAKSWVCIDGAKSTWVTEGVL